MTVVASVPPEQVPPAEAEAEEKAPPTQSSGEADALVLPPCETAYPHGVKPQCSAFVDVIPAHAAAHTGVLVPEQLPLNVALQPNEMSLLRL